MEADEIERVLRRVGILLTAKTGAKTPKAFFGWLTKQRLKPDTLAALTVALKVAGIKYYS
mgnify:FL=1